MLDFQVKSHNVLKLVINSNWTFKAKWHMCRGWIKHRSGASTPGHVLTPFYDLFLRWVVLSSPMCGVRDVASDPVVRGRPSPERAGTGRPQACSTKGTP